MTHDAASIAASGSDHMPTSVPAPLVTTSRPALRVWVLAIGCVVGAAAFMWASPDVGDLDKPFGSWTLLVVVLVFGGSWWARRINARRPSDSLEPTDA